MNEWCREYNCSKVHWHNIGPNEQTLIIDDLHNRDDFDYLFRLNNSAIFRKEIKKTRKRARK